MRNVVWLSTITPVLAIACFVGMGHLTSSHAQKRTIFGEPGTGQPTNTVLGILTGAATGAAIGESTGGKDGWWIGALVGSTVGGTIGNSWPTDHSVKYGHGSHHSRTYTSAPYYRHSDGIYNHYNYTASYDCYPRVNYTYHRPVTTSAPLVTAPVYTTGTIPSAPVVIEKPVVVENPKSAPYGFISKPGTLKSPWSDFEMSLGGLQAGQIVYDATNGKPFMVP